MALFLVLVAVPIIEIALFIQVGGWLGLWPTLAIVIVTAMAGTVLLRAQGLAALGRLRANLEAGQDPTGALAHGALILLAGVLLLTPGFFTDAVGLALMLPPVRAAVIRHLAARVTLVQVRTAGPYGGPGSAGTVDGEYEVVDPEPGSAPPPERRHLP